MMMMMMLFFCWKHCRKCQAPETSQFIHSVNKKRKENQMNQMAFHFETFYYMIIWQQQWTKMGLCFSCFELSCKWTSTLNGQRKKNQNQSQTNKKTFIKIDSFIISIHIHFEGVFSVVVVVVVNSIILSLFVRCIHSKKMINVYTLIEW